MNIDQLLQAQAQLAQARASIASYGGFGIGNHATSSASYPPPSFRIDTGTTVTFGSHTFEADQLGQLLSHLQSLYFPEHCL